MKRKVLLDYHGFMKEIEIEVVNFQYCYLPSYLTHVFRALPKVSVYEHGTDPMSSTKAYMKEIVFYYDHDFNGGTPVYYARDI